MGAMFNKPKSKPKSRVTEQDMAVLQLKKQRDKLKQYQKRIEQSLEQDRELARKCLQTGRKDRAKMLLRKKKYQEKLLENADAQLENLEKLTADLEFAQIELQVLEGLRAGNAALSKVLQILTVEEVERVLDDTKEAMDKQQEIDNLLNGVLSADDEDDVLAELDSLVHAESEQMPNAESGLTNKLPDIPMDVLVDQGVDSGEGEADRVKREKKAARIAVEA